MPDVNALSALARRFDLDFTGPIGHRKVGELAQAWLPDVNFHEVEMFYTIDLEELYTVPAEDFAAFDPLTQRDFAITVGGLAASPPVVVVNGGLRGQGSTARNALLQADVDADAGVHAGGNVRAADKFFGSARTRDGSPVPGPGNPRLPRELLRVRAEFRMLLETLKMDLALSQAEIDKPVDALWGEFDVTDLLLRQVDAVGADKGAASRSVRHAFARDLIREHEAGNFAAVQLKLQSPPPDGPSATRSNQTVWLALTTCGLLDTTSRTRTTTSIATAAASPTSTKGTTRAVASCSTARDSRSWRTTMAIR